MSAFLSNCYWVAENLLAGASFSSWSDSETLSNLEDLRAAKVTVIVSLISWSELVMGWSDQDWLERQIERHFKHYVFPVQDGGVPTRAFTQEILDAIDGELSANRRVYVHCRGGRGRTGTIVGCWLTRHGYGKGEEVLEGITSLRSAAHLDSVSPETEKQRSFVRTWDWQE
jgi:protein-tyrosine phosphatase